VMCSNQCNSAHAMFWKTGPIRPVLLALLLMSTWKLHVTGRSLGWTVVSLLLAFLPELVDIWNTNRTQQWQRSDMNPGGNYDEKAATSLSSLPIDAKVRLTIPTMGCVACVNKVDTSIRRCISAANNIKEERSWLSDTAAKGGVAELTVSGKTREEIDEVVEEVIAAVHDAGFVCKVASFEVHEK
jgi:copper chaperone CopZ